MSIARWNRLVSDVRCWIGWKLMSLAAWITDASIMDRANAWSWKRYNRRKAP